MGHASDQWQSRKEMGSLVLQDNVAYSFGLALLGCCCCLFLVLIRLLHFYIIFQIFFTVSVNR